MNKKKRKNKLLLYLYQIYNLLIFIPFLAILTIIVCIVIIAFATFNITMIRKPITFLWARSISLLTPMLVKVQGLRNFDSNKSYVIVSNHLSQFDIFVVYGWLPISILWVMKAELRKIPLFGYAAGKLGNIYIDRKNTAAAIQSLQRAKKKIKPGTSVAFFPEGTRSTTGNLLPFKKGAYYFALEMGLDILPISITGTNHILPTNTIKLFPGKAGLTIHKPIRIKDYSDKNIDKLIELTRTIIQKDVETD